MIERRKPLTSGSVGQIETNTSLCQRFGGMLRLEEILDKAAEN